MPIWKLVRWIAPVLLLASAPTASAASLWTWLGGNTSWCDPLAWSPSSQYPNDGNGGLTFDVDFSSGIGIIDCGAISIQALNVIGGVVEVQAGSSLDAQDTAVIGAFSATLRVTGSATTATTATGQLAGSGAILDGEGSFVSTGPFTFSAESMRGSGTTRIEGGLTITGGSTKALRDTRTLVLAAGSSNSWVNGDISLDTNGATLRTEPGASLTVTAPGRKLIGYAGSGLFDNQGTFVLDLPNPSDVFALQPGTLMSSGLIDVQQGILVLSSSVGSHSGVLQGTGILRQSGFSTVLQAGASLTVEVVEIEGGTLEILPGATFTVERTDLIAPAGGSLRLTGAATTATTATGQLAGSGAFLGGEGTFVSTGAFTFSEGTMRGSGTTRVEGSLTITGASTKSLWDTRTLVLGTGSSSIWNDGDVFLTSGTLRIEPEATLTVTATGRSLGSVSGSFDNQGSFVLSLPDPSDVFTLSAGTQTNTGLIDVQQGRLDVLASFTQTAGALHLSGGSISATGVQLQITDGALEGTGTVTGDVALGGLLSPGLPVGGDIGEIDIVGSLDCAATAVSRFELHGLVRGTGYDAVDVSLGVVLDGSIQLLVAEGLADGLGPGDQFTLLTSDGLSGSFSNVVDGERLFQSNGDSFEIHYGPGAPQPDRVVADGFRRWQPVGFLQISGLATGGTINLRLAGVPLVVAVDPSDTAAEVAQKIADAINADFTLRALGVFAKVQGRQVIVNAFFQQAGSGDPGIQVQTGVPLPALSLVGRALLAAALALCVPAARRRDARRA